MPTCPHCNQQANRRKGGCCPLCGKEVHVVKEGKKPVWVADKTSSAELVYILEEHVKTYWQLPHFSFGDPGDFDNGGARKRFAQMGVAKRLLQWCGHNQELARTIIDCYFDGSRRLYPVKSMQGVIGKQFNLAKAIAQKQLEQQEIQARAAERRLNELKPHEVFLGV